jgi:N-acetylglucosamine-6-phosphate deacetylase
MKKNLMTQSLIDLVKMITLNPARALVLDPHIGKLAAGMKADVTMSQVKNLIRMRVY